MSTGPVSLVDGMSPVLLVDGMAAGIRGSADVLYTAVADPDQGVGTDVHSITFTMIQP